MPNVHTPTKIGDKVLSWATDLEDKTLHQILNSKGT